jgi:Holliday junction resolvase RusA-like endonuclease
LYFTGKIYIEGRIPSENFLYKPSCRGGKAHLYKNPKIREYQKEIISKGKNTDLINIRNIDRVLSTELSLLFCLNSDFYKRDTTNFLKATEDALVELTGIDDGRTIKIEVGKELVDESCESIYVGFKINQQNSCLCGCGGFPKSLTASWVRGHDKKGSTCPIESKIKQVRTKLGRDPIISPYVPGLFLSYHEDNKRWIASKNPYTGNSAYHAKVVYMHVYGEIPDGYHVHHKNGKHESIEDDHPDNLIAIPKEWNFKKLPYIAKWSNVDESVITDIYCDLVDKVPEEDLFLEICWELKNRGSIYRQ